MANDPHFLVDASSKGVSGLSLEAGVLLGNKYRLLRPAGFGGMGAVWVARNEATSADVALKILVTAHQGVDQESIARFRREAHAAAQLYHRGIVRIFDLVELTLPGDDADSIVRSSRSPASRAPSPSAAQVPDALVLVMELLRGDTLASHMEKKHRFSQEETLAIVIPLLSALAHAHAQGIVHRDLKPENVFLSVDPDGHVIPKILDFGISKLLEPTAPRITTDGALLGTPSYMSPEQARGQPNVDARADVFAAGIVIYECLAGENPFSSGSYHSVVAAILERDPAPLKNVSAEVWGVIRRALEKSPALRHADAGELAGALIAAAQAAGLPTPETSGAFPASARGSLADRSVPPAPFREQDPTLLTTLVEKRRRTRTRGVIGAVAMAAALASGGGIYVRAMRAPRVDAASTPAHASPTTGVESAPVASPPSSAASSAPQAPFGAATITVTRAPPEAAASASPRPHAPGRPGHSSVKPPPPPNPPPATPRSTVVRDPGF